MMNTPKEFTGHVNLGNSHKFTINELTKKIIDKTKIKSIQNHHLPKEDPSKRKPYISLVMKNLNWSPKIILEEGLNKTIKYYQDII